jgi:glycosyltransferase involved in cell wall biosynthesis
MNSIAWFDPVNRDAHFLKLIAEIIYRQNSRFKVISTNREGMELDLNVPFQPFFESIHHLGIGSPSATKKLNMLLSYYSGFKKVATTLPSNTSVLYSSGMTLPELEYIGLQKLRCQASKITMLVHNLEDTTQSRFTWLSQQRSRCLIKSFDSWLFLSDYMRNRALSCVNLDAEKTYVMLHPHFRPMLQDIKPDEQLISQIQLLAKGRPVMAYISRLNPDHGIDLFYQILQKSQSQGLPLYGVVIGRLSRSWDLQKNEVTIKSYNLDQEQVFIIPRKYDYSEVLAVLKTADFVLAPYRRISQSGAIALALGEQVPVLATSVGANSEMIKNGVNGFLFSPDNLDNLIDELSFTYKNGKTMRERFPPSSYFNLHLDPEVAVANMLNWLQK